MTMVEVYSHDGKLLKDHLLNVMNLGLSELEKKALNFSNNEEIKTLAKIVFITHDFGKGTSFFQQKLESGSGDRRANHGQLSALFTHFLLRRLSSDPLIPLLGLCIVARHHGNLKDFRNMVELPTDEWALLEEQFAHCYLSLLDSVLQQAGLSTKLHSISFADLQEGLEPASVRRKLRKLKKSHLTELSNYFTFSLVYSLLVWADKGDAIFTANQFSFEQLKMMVSGRRDIASDIVEQFKMAKNWLDSTSIINQMRNQIYDEIVEQVQAVSLEKRIFSINVPTGTGKTLAGLSAALHLRQRIQKAYGQTFRLVYSLPFTSIIDQNYAVFYEVLNLGGVQVDEQVLLKHHYLTPKSYHINEEYDDQFPDVSEHLVETWSSEIVVTTFVQLLHTIFSNQNRSLKNFHQLANSIILLDEVQSIPHRYWLLIREVLQVMSQTLNCYFIFLTATMPLIFNEAADEIAELAPSKGRYFEFFDRITLDVSLAQEEMTVEEFQEILLADLMAHPDESFLIVLNTIGTSIQIFNYLKKQLRRDNLVYLSTNIIPKERMARIEEIKDSKGPTIIVSTQMIEAGVDLDLDRVYRDFGPLDSINQTCGRCNRNYAAGRRGIVKLVNLVNQNHQNHQYANYVYDDYLLTKTKDVLRHISTDMIEEKVFYQMNKDYFERVNQVKSDDTSLELLKRINRLQYMSAFEDDRDLEPGKSKVFQLIEKDQETVNLFIEVDKQAAKIWDQYSALSKVKDPFQRKRSFERLKGEFLEYVITIPKQSAQKQLESDQLDHLFNYISQEQVENTYDVETGFIRENIRVNLVF